MNEAIKIAIEKGGYKDTEKWIPLEKERVLTLLTREWAFVMVDPLFWQALGKALGWKVGTDKRFDGYSYEWQHYAHQYFDLLLTGGDIEAFWKELLKQNV